MAKRKKQLKLPVIDEPLVAHRRYSNALRWLTVHKKKLEYWQNEVAEAQAELSKFS